MQHYNPISTAITKETKFIEEINAATVRFFDDKKMELLHTSKKREIKAYRDDENNIVYVLDKQDNKIMVNFDMIHYFQKDKSNKEIIAWQYREKKGVVDEELHMMTVIECDTNKNVKKIKKEVELTEEQFKEKMLSKCTTEEDKETINKVIESLKKIYGDNYYQAILNQRNANKSVQCSTDVGNIHTYMELLNDKGYMNTKYPVEFFSQLNQEAIPQYQEMLSDWIIGMNGMIKACEEQKHTTYDNCFVFNDSDNHVWAKNNKLYLSDQNVGFYFEIKDDNNFVVYYLAKEYQSVTKEIKRIEKSLKEGTIKPLKDIALTVENGKVTALNYSLMYCLELDIEYSVNAMKEEGILKVKYPVDITTYEYQKNYYAQKMGLSEFEFVAQAMMTNGGGFDYDKQSGSFLDNKVKYIPNLEEAPNTRDEKVTTFNYLLPKQISYLNADWLDGLKYAVEVLKKDRPKAHVFKGDDVEDALDKAIKYFEIKIKKLEEKPTTTTKTIK